MWWWRQRREEDLERELASHLAAEAEEQENSGVSSDEAYYAARRKLGNAPAIKEATRETWGWTSIGILGQDLRYSIRRLRRNAASTAIVLLLLGLGIGTNTLIFSALNVLNLRSLRVRQPEQLVQFSATVLSNPNNPADTWGFRAYTAARDKAKSLSAVFAWGELRVPLSGEASNEEVAVSLATANFFSELGIQARYGRTLIADDDSATAADPMPAVLSYGFWYRHFNGDRRAVGQTIRLKGYPFQIVGVLPEDFTGMQVDSSPDLWIPSRAASLFPAGQEPLEFQVYGRLAPGFGLQEAEADVYHAVDPWKDEESRKSFRFRLIPVGKGNSLLRPQLSQPLVLLMWSASALVLLVCANVAGLLLARAAAQRKEISVRLALGGSRWRIAREFLLDVTLLSVGGGGLGLTLAFMGAPVLEQSVPPVWTINATRLPVELHLQPDHTVFLFTIGICALATLLAGLLPSISACRTDITPVLKDSMESKRGLVASAMVVVQVALCAALLFCTALLTRTFTNLQTVDPGFTKDRVITFSMDFRTTQYTVEKATHLAQSLLDGARSIPGVRSAALAARTPMRNWGLGMAIAPVGKAVPRAISSSMNQVSTDYFRTMGINLLAGRDFTEGDMEETKPIPVVVNKRFAERFFPEGPSIGHLFGSGKGIAAPTYQIIGVVNDSKYRSLREIIPPVFYVPARSFPILNLEVRTDGNPNSLVGPIQKLLRGLDPELAFSPILPLAEEVNNSLWHERVLVMVATAFGVLAGLISAIGLYGMLSYSVVQRQRELALRIALGASAVRLIRSLLIRVAVIVAAGIALGTGVFMTAGRIIQPALYGTRLTDPFGIASTAAFLLLIATAAAFLPVLRAIRIDPAHTLRAEGR